MKIKLSKSQWEFMGRKAGWMKMAQDNNLDNNPETLANILRAGKDDEASRNAAKNPNCPPEMLVEIVKRGKDDGVSLCAVQNQNCPQEALVEILKRRKNDTISNYAADNPNCPPHSKAAWMQLVGNFKKNINWDS